MVSGFPDVIPDKAESNDIIINRIIALWGFNEAVFGGILHALRIPFTGLFIGSIAVILISLLAHYSRNKSIILKATIVVIMVKAIFSPHTPVIAYSAVLLQGLLGYSIFSIIRYKPAAAIILGFFSLLFSALQKLIITTVVFGTEFWKSIDLFADYVFSQIKVFHNSKTFSISILLISVYTLAHVTAGIIAGFYAVKIPSKIKGKKIDLLKREFEAAKKEALSLPGNGEKKRSWWKKPSRIILFIFLIGVLALTYFFPMNGNNHAYDILIMLLRAVIIITLWFFIISSALKKYLRKIITKYQFRHAAEIERIADLFPSFRKIIIYCWNKSGTLGGLKRIKMFLTESIVLMLVCDL